MMASKLRVGLATLGMVLGTVAGCGSDESVTIDGDSDSSAGTGGSAGSGANAGTSGSSGGASGSAGNTGDTGGTSGDPDAAGDAGETDGGAGATDGSTEASPDGRAGSSGTGAGGTSGASPGSVACGSAPCAVPANSCCISQGFPLPTQCMPGFPGCVTLGVPVACDDKSDCPNNEVCCAHRGGAVGGAAISAIQCESSCNGGNDVLVCANGGDCTMARICRAFPAPLASYRGCLPPG